MLPWCVGRSLWAPAALPGKDPGQGYGEWEDTCDWLTAGTQLLYRLWRGLRQQTLEVKGQLLDQLTPPVYHDPALRTPKAALVVTSCLRTFLQV